MVFFRTFRIFSAISFFFLNLSTAPTFAQEPFNHSITIIYNGENGKEILSALQNSIADRNLYENKFTLNIVNDTGEKLPDPFLKNIGKILKKAYYLTHLSVQGFELSTPEIFYSLRTLPRFKNFSFRDEHIPFKRSANDFCLKGKNSSVEDWEDTCGYSQVFWEHIGKLVPLVTLDLSHTSRIFHNSHPCAMLCFKKNIEKLIHLKELNISNTMAYEKGIFFYRPSFIILWRAVALLPSLKKLGTAENNLAILDKDDELKNIVSETLNKLNLEHLDLSQNNLQDSSVIFSALCTKKLKTLNLSHNTINGRDADSALINLLQNLEHTLENLSLRENPLKNCSSAFNALNKITTLSQLDCENIYLFNPVGDKLNKVIPLAPNLRFLTSLNLGNNRFEASEGAAILSRLPSTLQSLSLQSFFKDIVLEGTYYNSVEHLSRLTHLKHLDLSCNNFGEADQKDSENFSIVLSGLTHLKSLNLSNNNLQNSSLNMLSKLPTSLTLLNLDSNFFDKDMIKYTDIFKRLSHLRYLSFIECRKLSTYDCNCPLLKQEGFHKDFVDKVITCRLKIAFSNSNIFSNPIVEFALR